MRTLPETLYRASQVRELDRRAIEDHGVPGYELMSRAGAAAWNVLRARWPQAKRVAIYCGAGNNGGDGYVLGRLAKTEGLDVRVYSLGDAGRRSDDAGRAYKDYIAGGGEVQDFNSADTSPVDVIVDAMLGTGLERPLQGVWRDAVESINQSSAPVLAIDVPTGLQADTGQLLGAAVAADVTATFIALKQGLFTGEGPALSGEIVFEDLDVPLEIYANVEPAARLIGDNQLSGVLPPRKHTAHKGAFGHVLVVGGNLGMPGAVRLAGEAALRSGGGLVSVATRPEHVNGLVAGRPELMCCGIKEASDIEPLLARASVIAVGPGLGKDQWAQGLLQKILKSPLPVVADADALNLLAEKPAKRDSWVITPHPGEAGRLLKMDTASVQADRYAAVERLSKDYSAVAVLKGAGSLVKHPDKTTWVCHHGNPGMATAGMGDVLTGIIAGLIAQGLSLPDAARAGVLLHAKAADAAAEGGERGLLASDLMPFLRRQVNRMQ